MVREAKDGLYFAEADAAAAAVAVARVEAHESVDHEGEEAGGAGTFDDKSCSREHRALLQKLVLEHGVGGLETKVTRELSCGVSMAEGLAAVLRDGLHYRKLCRVLTLIQLAFC